MRTAFRVRMQDNDELIRRAASADREALEALLVRHLPGLEGYLRLRMGPAMRARETSADLVQSVAREVLVDLSAFEYRGEAAFKHWLYTRAQHKLLEKQRWHTAQRRDVARELPLDDASSVGILACYKSLCSPSAQLQAQEAIARIEAAFDELPDDYKDAITLHRMMGLSQAEVATKMDRSEGAVRNLVYRGLSRLALRLSDGTAGEPPAAG